MAGFTWQTIRRSHPEMLRKGSHHQPQPATGEQMQNMGDQMVTLMMGHKKTSARTQGERIRAEVLKEFNGYLVKPFGTTEALQ
jgi:hypothetical protein